MIITELLNMIHLSSLVPKKYASWMGAMQHTVTGWWQVVGDALQRSLFLAYCTILGLKLERLYENIINNVIISTVDC